MDHKQKEQHESYGMISAHRISGGDGNLFGSSIKHFNSIRITIKRGEKERDLNQDWYFGKEAIVEVDLSPAQFADLITSMNQGDGVPCTLRRVNGKSMEECPEISERQIFEKEFKEKMASLNSQIQLLVQEMEDLFAKPSVNKGDRKEILEKVRSVMMNLVSNFPFIHSQFNEAMDKTVREAKAEVEAYVSKTLLSLGQREFDASSLLPDGSEPKKLCCEG